MGGGGGPDFGPDPKMVISRFARVRPPWIFARSKKSNLLKLGKGLPSLENAEMTSLSESQKNTDMDSDEVPTLSSISISQDGKGIQAVEWLRKHV